MTSDAADESCIIQQIQSQLPDTNKAYSLFISCDTFMMLKNEGGGRICHGDDDDRDDDDRDDDDRDDDDRDDDGDNDDGDDDGDDDDYNYDDGYICCGDYDVALNLAHKQYHIRPRKTTMILLINLLMGLPSYEIE